MAFRVTPSLDNFEPPGGLSRPLNIQREKLKNRINKP